MDKTMARSLPRLVHMVDSGVSTSRSIRTAKLLLIDDGGCATTPHSQPVSLALLVAMRVLMALDCAQAKPAPAHPFRLQRKTTPARSLCRSGRLRSPFCSDTSMWRAKRLLSMLCAPTLRSVLCLLLPRAVHVQRLWREDEVATFADALRCTGLPELCDRRTGLD